MIQEIVPYESAVPVMELFTPMERIGDMKTKAALLPALEMTKVNN